MTAIERTAYPRFKRILSAKDLEEVYTPTPAERFLAFRSTKGTVAEIGFLVLLKTHQRLGRFISLSEVPSSVLSHIIKLVDSTLDVADLESYDCSGTRQRHIPLIRVARQLQPYGPVARTCALKAMIAVARTKEDVADLINVALEALAKDGFELPPFATLDKAAHHVRAITTRGVHDPKKYGMRLIAGMRHVVVGLAKMGVIISKIYTYSSTPDGIRIGRGLGFQDISPTPDQPNRLLLLDVDISDSPFAEEYRKALKQYREATRKK